MDIKIRWGFISPNFSGSSIVNLRGLIFAFQVLMKSGPSSLGSKAPRDPNGKSPRSTFRVARKYKALALAPTDWRRHLPMPSFIGNRQPSQPHFHWARTFGSFRFWGRDVVAYVGSSMEGFYAH